MAIRLQERQGRGGMKRGCRKGVNDNIIRNMFNLDKFISDSLTFRPESMFVADIKVNADVLTQEIKGKKVCVIGGAGSIGSSFIKAVLRFEPMRVVGMGLKENGRAERVRRPA